MRGAPPRFTRGRSKTPRTTLKMAALAPMPSASVTMTVRARPEARVRERRANLKSVIRLMARRPPGIRVGHPFTLLVEAVGPFSTPAAHFYAGVAERHVDGSYVLGGGTHLGSVGRVGARESETRASDSGSDRK